MDLAGSLESSKEVKNGEILSLSKINKIGIGFISIFSFESSSFIFHNFKTEKLKLTFKG